MCQSLPAFCGVQRRVAETSHCNHLRFGGLQALLIAAMPELQDSESDLVWVRHVLSLVVVRCAAFPRRSALVLRSEPSGYGSRDVLLVPCLARAHALPSLPGPAGPNTSPSAGKPWQKAQQGSGIRHRKRVSALIRFRRSSSVNLVLRGRMLFGVANLSVRNACLRVYVWATLDVRSTKQR